MGYGQEKGGEKDRQRTPEGSWKKSHNEQVLQQKKFSNNCTIGMRYACGWMELLGISSRSLVNNKDETTKRPSKRLWFNRGKSNVAKKGQVQNCKSLQHKVSLINCLDNLML